MYSNKTNIPNAWIYIAIDIRDLSICKVGLTTTENPKNRISQGNTSNPFYILFNCYNLSEIGISKEELTDFERYLHKKLGPRIRIVASGEKSEWIETSPFCAEDQIEHFISNAFSLKGQSFQDEDGSVKTDTMNSIKYAHRPCHLHIHERINYCKYKEYLDFLISLS